MKENKGNTWLTTSARTRCANMARTISFKWSRPKILTKQKVGKSCYIRFLSPTLYISRTSSVRWLAKTLTSPQLVRSKKLFKKPSQPSPRPQAQSLSAITRRPTAPSIKGKSRDVISLPSTLHSAESPALLYPVVSSDAGLNLQGALAESPDLQPHSVQLEQHELPLVPLPLGKVPPAGLLAPRVRTATKVITGTAKTTIMVTTTAGTHPRMRGPQNSSGRTRVDLLLFLFYAVLMPNK